MAIDLTGGIDPAREQMFASRPDNPEMRDSVSFWVVDDRGESACRASESRRWPPTGMPTTSRSTSRSRTAGSSGCATTARRWPAEGPDGRPTVLGAGGLGFRCVDPFDTWTMTFDGKAVQTSSQRSGRGQKDGPLVDVSFRVEATMAVPPWVQGALSGRRGIAAEDARSRAT